jgi:hypothetical protein
MDGILLLLLLLLLLFLLLSAKPTCKPGKEIYKKLGWKLFTP